MNIPTRIGERYLCFIVKREDRGWGGPYGMQRWPTVLVCEDCGYIVRGTHSYEMKRMADHHEHGHAPCARCGEHGAASTDHRAQLARRAWCSLR